MTVLKDISLEAKNLAAIFEATGAEVVEMDFLQISNLLLDLYGEDIRGRAFITNDPVYGEMMLRPDFTIPIVEQHMAKNVSPARYTYCGKVFRRQEEFPDRPREFLQVGYEIFDGANPAKADAEVFSLVNDALSGIKVRISTGDIGILMAAVSSLSTTETRKKSLLRHIWRPQRFRTLLNQFSGLSSKPHPIKDAKDYNKIIDKFEIIGSRNVQEIKERLQQLKSEHETAPIDSAEVKILDDILSLKDTSKVALSYLEKVSKKMPGIEKTVNNFAKRLDFLENNGVNLDLLDFEGSYGRTSMEYYDGFVFGFYSETYKDLAPVATGGRYDALTERMGQGKRIPAVGAVLRPDLTLLLRGNKHD
ncbi:MAG: ATP phosphoribosyltransferase regulatory subunit [Rhodobacteraceae bacterium]|nr:ATP phosphoribosyltransferase regulatory subunit [Paracoccaceae bacterium]